MLKLSQKSKIKRNYEKFQRKVDEKRRIEHEAKREKQAKEMKLIEEQIKERELVAKYNKEKVNEENKEIRDQYLKDKEVSQSTVCLICID